MVRSATRALSLHCEHFRHCDGCAFETNLHAPPLLATANLFWRARGVALSPVCADDASGWRSTAKLAVRAHHATREPTLGLFRRGTHRIEPVPRCVVHAPPINEALALLTDELRRPGAPAPYDEAGSGLVKYVQCNVERSTARVQLTLVAHLDDADAAGGASVCSLAESLWRRGGGAASWHSIWLNLNPSRANNIFDYGPKAWVHLLGDEHLVERPPSGAAVHLPPYVFRQANLGAFDAIIARTKQLVPHGARLVEWYSGVGLLGLALAPQAEWVRCSDVNPRLVEPFERSRSALGPEAAARVSFALGAAGDRLCDADGADCALVDPPRKGLDAPLLAALCSDAADVPCSTVRRLIYVSCGFAALMKDADALLAAGWRVVGGVAEAHLLNLGADHIETLVAFEREPARLVERGQPGV